MMTALGFIVFVGGMVVGSYYRLFAINGCRSWKGAFFWFLTSEMSPEGKRARWFVFVAYLVMLVGAVLAWRGMR